MNILNYLFFLFSFFQICVGGFTRHLKKEEAIHMTYFNNAVSDIRHTESPTRLALEEVKKRFVT